MRKGSYGWPSAAVAILAATGLVVAVLPGIPLLRHDWSPSPYLLGPLDTLISTTTGWSTDGFGAARPHIDGYIIGLPLAAASLVPIVGFPLYVLLAITGLLASFGARALGREAGGEWAGAAAAIFAVFNPWTYTELVAGHVYMLLAYGATIMLVREALRDNPRQAVLTLYALLTLQQLQFFVIATAIVAIACARIARWAPVCLLAVAWLPNICGMIMERATLDAIPYIASWERGEAVALARAVQLNGYVPDYGAVFCGIFATPVLVTLALAVAGAFLRKRGSLVIAGACALIFLLTSEVPDQLTSWMVEHLRVSALFRESFDLLAYVTIAYVVLAAAASRLNTWLARAWFLIVLLLPAAWIIAPPARYWVSSTSIPHLRVQLPANTRFALVPAFQPMSFQGRGSGADPALLSLANNVTPVNEYLATYPVDAALAALITTRDATPLEALSVGAIVSRPSLSTDFSALRYQWALPPPAANVHIRNAVLRPAPELALQSAPRIETFPKKLDAGDILFGDAAEVKGPLVPAFWHQFSAIERVRSDSSSVDARGGWVDARFAFAVRPALAQPFGGAVTVKSNVVLRVHPDRDALVWVQGALLTRSGQEITRTTAGYRWVPLPDGTTGVTCQGLCVVAAEGSPPPMTTLSPPAQPKHAISFQLFVPWILVADVPPGPSGAIRYNVAFDPNWQAYIGGVALSHFRMDGIANAWLLPERHTGSRIVIVEVAAALQFFLELVCLAVIIVASIRFILQGLRAPKREMYLHTSPGWLERGV